MAWLDSLERDGAVRRPATLDAQACLALETAVSAAPEGRPGVRLAGVPELGMWLDATGSVGRLVAAAIGEAAWPVRAVLFDKSDGNNWALGWHQDRTIVVQRRADVPGFGPWTIKAGLDQVEPPFAVIERMITVRIHLDPVDRDNAPLRIVPGSHGLGRLPESEIDGVVARHGERICLAERGDVWLYRTAIVHGSRAATVPRRRRVLQVDYAADILPHPLEWRGLD